MFIYFRDRRIEKEKEREGINVREKYPPVASCTVPDWKWNLKLFSFQDNNPFNWATSARAGLFFISVWQLLQIPAQW